MRTIMLMMAGWLLCMAASAQKETRIYQFDKPLYGAAYYAEYTPTDRLDEDIRLMKEAHLTVVRVGHCAAFGNCRSPVLRSVAVHHGE